MFSVGLVSYSFTQVNCLEFMPLRMTLYMVRTGPCKSLRKPWLMTPSIIKFSSLCGRASWGLMRASKGPRIPHGDVSAMTPVKWCVWMCEESHFLIPHICPIFYKDVKAHVGGCNMYLIFAGLKREYCNDKMTSVNTLPCMSCHITKREIPILFS